MMNSNSVLPLAGYGLNYESELKQLQIANEVKKTEPVDVVITFLGAHAVPE